MTVRTFKPQFAPLVKAGTKRQTIRPIPKRPQDMPKVGDLESWREWTGKPYRSKQRELAVVRIAGVWQVNLYGQLRPEAPVIFQTFDGTLPRYGSLDQFASADGFSNFPEMLEWFERTHSLPFTGILIRAEDT